MATVGDRCRRDRPTQAANVLAIDELMAAATRSTRPEMSHSGELASVGPDAGELTSWWHKDERRQVRRLRASPIGVRRPTFD